ncbi:MAG: F0F1 ATP synthase subunit epsilon [Bacteroides sp.]|nr:F0F1 ATP synthase subunit epsilon [Bacteroides sp.]
MTLRLISPSEVVFEGTVDSVTLPGSLGSFTVLPRHAALISTLVKGRIVYSSNGQDHEVATDGGLVDVLNDVVSVCIY